MGLVALQAVEIAPCVFSVTRAVYRRGIAFSMGFPSVRGSNRARERTRTQTGHDIQQAVSGVKILNAARRRSSRFPCPRRLGSASSRAFGREPERRLSGWGNGVVGSRAEQAGGGVDSGAERNAAGSAQACERRRQRRRCKRATDGNAVVPEPARASEVQAAGKTRRRRANSAGELSGYPVYAGELTKRRRNTSHRQDRPHHRGSNRHSVSGLEILEMRAKPWRCSLGPG